jgi:hypothetical protein
MRLAMKFSNTCNALINVKRDKEIRLHVFLNSNNNSMNNSNNTNSTIQDNSTLTTSSNINNCDNSTSITTTSTKSSGDSNSNNTHNININIHDSGLYQIPGLTIQEYGNLFAPQANS